MNTAPVMLVSILLLFMLTGCSSYRVIPVDVAVQNMTSLPNGSIELERHTYAYRSIQFMYELYERKLIDNRQLARLDEQGRAHLRERIYLYSPEQGDSESVNLRLIVRPPESFAEVKVNSPLLDEAAKPDLRCRSRLPAVCRDVWKGEWHLEAWQPRHDLLLTERTLRLVITPEFSRIARQLVAKHGVPPRFVLEYSAWQKGAPLREYGCHGCSESSLERDLWIRGRRRIDLVPALRLEKPMVVEIPVFVLTPRQRPEFEERIRLEADFPELRAETFAFPARSVSNMERVSEILLDRERYEWLAPRVRLRQEASRMFEALYRRDVKQVEALLAAGLDPHTRDAYGYPLFYRAAQQGTPEIMALFIKHGASVDGACREFVNQPAYKLLEFRTELEKNLQRLKSR